MPGERGTLCRWGEREELGCGGCLGPLQSDLSLVFWGTGRFPFHSSTPRAACGLLEPSGSAQSCSVPSLLCCAGLALPGEELPGDHGTLPSQLYI